MNGGGYFNVLTPPIKQGQQGAWICPRCGVVNAWWVPRCTCKPSKPVYNSGAGDTE